MANCNLIPIPFTSVKIKDDFWRPRMSVHSHTTLAADLELCEKTGRIDNFRKSAGFMDGDFIGNYFDDSDVYKVIEGIGYSLQTIPNKQLEEQTDEVIDIIAAAQRPDGYLNTYFTMPPNENKRWTDMEKHEMYCCGHLIEAAIAYYQGTGKEKLLLTARRFADHLVATFLGENRPWVPGHEEIELALIKLYRLTEENSYIQLAQYLLDQRGHGHGRGAIWEKPEFGPLYCQDDLPVEKLRKVSGHAVRAMFLYTAMADIMSQTGSSRYAEALDCLWESVVHRNMYVTGGIGSSARNEGFTQNYDLPNEEAYCETCASFGMVLWNNRMNLLKGEARYADVMERAMYNGLLAGVSLKGDQYFYVNPLSSTGAHHRQEWFCCSCCPTQIARFLPSVGGYIYAADPSGEALYINLFMKSSADINLPGGNQVILKQETTYPWDGKVRLTVDKTDALVTLMLRVPSWCASFTLLHNGKKAYFPVKSGYAELKGVQSGDEIEYVMDMPVVRMHADERIVQDRNRVCLARGPLIYCVEQADLKRGMEAALASNDIIEEHFDFELLGGVVVLDAFAPGGQKRLRAIPYYAWDNRGPGSMEVWLKETAGEQTKDLYC